MSRAFDVGRSQAVAEEYAARTAAMLVPGSALRVGYDRHGRFCASRYVEGVGIVLTAERPIVAVRPERQPQGAPHDRESHVLDGGRYLKEAGHSARRRSFGRADGPPPLPKALPPVVR